MEWHEEGWYEQKGSTGEGPVALPGPVGEMNEFRARPGKGERKITGDGYLNRTLLDKEFGKKKTAARKLADKLRIENR